MGLPRRLRRLLCDDCRRRALTFPGWSPALSDGCTCAFEMFRRCCVDHDALYWYASCSACRRRADDYFLGCMLAKARTPLGVVVAYARYWAVRAFGWCAFDKSHKRLVLA